MARKQLPRTKHPAVQQGKPGPSPRSSFVVPFGRGGRERFPPSSPYHLPSSRVNRSGEGRKGGREGAGAPAGGTERLFEGRSLKASQLRRQGPDWAKECAECGGGRQGRLAARDALTPRVLRLSPREGRGRQRAGRIGRCGQRTVPPVTWTARGPFSVSDFQISQNLSSPKSFTGVLLNQARASI